MSHGEETSRFSISGLTLGISKVRLNTSVSTLIQALNTRTQVDPFIKDGWKWTNSDLKSGSPFLWAFLGSSYSVKNDIVQSLQRYIALGGTVFFESDGSPRANQQLIHLRKKVFFSDKSVRLKKGDLLTRTFYILPKSLASKFKILKKAGRVVWIESEQPLLVTLNGRGDQREMGTRAAINIVLYSLTGNYKDDLTHLKYLMRRKKN